MTAPDGYRWIDRQADFDDLVARLIDSPRYALDTEFHRERTYFPKLALLQVATEDEILVVDPLPLDLSGLRKVFASDSLAVLHAAQQDLDVLTHACAAVPARLYDTQLAAGFLGYGTPSLVSLLHGELHVSVAKGDRLTDWLRRPLTEAQRAYAASDVAHLLDLHDVLSARTDQLGRSEWVAAACEELRTKPTSGTAPGDAWLRLKDVKNLRPKSRGVARSVAEWRERRAMELDIPVRQVMPDLAVLGVAQKAPTSLNELAGARGVDERHSRGNTAQQILAAVAAGVGQPVDHQPNDVDDLDRTLRPAITLISAWVSELARRQKLDNSLLATRADLVALVRGDADARLRHGWRAEVLGDQIERLLNGSAGLTFDAQRGLRLISVDPIA